MIAFFEEDIKVVALEKARLKRWIKEVCSTENREVGNLNYIFCSDEYLLNINKEYLNHDFYTDIITFDQSEGKKIEGEIYISVDRVVENSISQNQTFKDELHRVIIHGVLHLLGYGDKSPGEKIKMRHLEDECLKILNGST